jgi:glutathione synthase/RimK-type ligase-like ATP-grasp enzyme
VKKNIVILEAKSEYHYGKDKSRKDTTPIIEALSKDGFSVEVIFYKNSKKDEIKEYLKNSGIDALLVRVTAGTIPKVDEFFGFLDSVAKMGIKVYTDHKHMLKIDYKDILIKLKDKPYCTSDIKEYHTIEEFRKEFLKSIMSSRIRVLKRNYGSFGEDVWLVKIQDDGSVIADEAIDNKKIVYKDLIDFMRDFEKRFDYKQKKQKYIKNRATFIDMRYLSQIQKGEYRVLLVKDEIKHIIHKKPIEDSFSTSYLSGAIYETKKPQKEKWDDLKKSVADVIKDIKKEIKELPVLWSIDFIKENKKHILVEINSSCVEIDTVPEIAEDIAKEIKKDLK